MIGVSLDFFSQAVLMNMLWLLADKGVEGLWRMPLMWSNFSAGVEEKSFPSLNLAEMVSVFS